MFQLFLHWRKSNPENRIDECRIKPRLWEKVRGSLFGENHFAVSIYFEAILVGFCLGILVSLVVQSSFFGISLLISFVGCGGGGGILRIGDWF
jgi:hypothetical protein